MIPQTGHTVLKVIVPSTVRKEGAEEKRNMSYMDSLLLWVELCPLQGKAKALTSRTCAGGLIGIQDPCRCHQVKMRPYWIGGDPKMMTGVLTRRRESGRGHRHSKGHMETKTDWKERSTSQGVPRVALNHQKLGRGKTKGFS